MAHAQIINTFAEHKIEYCVDQNRLTLHRGRSQKEYQLLKYKRITSLELNELMNCNNYPFVFLGSCIDEASARLLKKLDIQFIDTLGNCFIALSNSYIYVHQAQKRAKQVRLAPSALKSAGIKFAYNTLKYAYSNKDFLTLPIKRCVKESKVSLGSASSLKKIIQSQYYNESDSLNKTSLLRDFCTSYKNILKPKITIYACYCEFLDQLLGDEKIVISGQHAIREHLKSKYIKPRMAHLYVDEAGLGDLVFDHNLQKDSSHKNNVFLYKKIFVHDEHYAPLFLAYADLLFSNDPRDKDLALEIADELK